MGKGDSDESPKQGRSKERGEATLQTVDHRPPPCPLPVLGCTGLADPQEHADREAGKSARFDSELKNHILLISNFFLRNQLQKSLPFDRCVKRDLLRPCLLGAGAGELGSRSWQGRRRPRDPGGRGALHTADGRRQSAPSRCCRSLLSSWSTWREKPREDAVSPGRPQRHVIEVCAQVPPRRAWQPRTGDTRRSDGRDQSVQTAPTLPW